MENIDEINIRVKEIRVELNLTAREFGEVIDLSSSAIINMEKGIRKVTDRTINQICKNFKINEQWIRYGIGEILSDQNDEMLHQIKKLYNLDEVDELILIEFLTMDSKNRKKLKELMVKSFMNNSLAEQELSVTLQEDELNEFDQIQLDNIKKEMISMKKGAISSAIPYSNGKEKIS
jgi:transcriptional regulator with XRE-family HTH domain